MEISLRGSLRGGSLPSKLGELEVLRRFPLGGGSSGVRLYVTVRVTTWRTLTDLAGVALRGVSKYRIFQSDGEKGEHRPVALRGVALSGVAVRGEGMPRVLMEAGMRNLLRAGGDFGDFALIGEYGGRETAGDFKDGAVEKAGLVAEEG